MPSLTRQNTEVLEAALIGFQHMRAELEQKIADLNRQIRGESSSRPVPARSSGAAKRVLSAAARQRIAAAQKKRWAAYKAKQGQKDTPKPKARVLSAAGRARIAAATRKRWAAFRKAQEAKAAQ